MAKIKSNAAYEAAMKRIEELEELVDDHTSPTDARALELDILVDMVEEYEDAHYPIGVPQLVDVIKLRMYEMGLTQKKLAEMLRVSQSRISEYLSGKSEPTLRVARELSQKLDIAPSVVLGM